MGKKQVPLPAIFIGSSREGLPIVRAVIEVFKQHARCVPWNAAPQFSTRGSFTTFNALCEAAQQYDFALFILTPDDELKHRKQDYVAPRDNVIFEMGLFIAAIGPERVVGLVKDVAKPTIMKIPSDLLGVNIPRFEFTTLRSKASLESVKKATEGFVQTVVDLGFREIRLELAHTWGFVTNKNKPSQFEVHLGAANLAASKKDIRKMEISLAARLRDQSVNFEDDATVVYSKPRAVPNPLTDLVLHIPENQFPKAIAKGDYIQGRVVLVPAGTDLSQFASLKEATRHGCRVVERCRATA
ncbi:MAG TPA: nucleotide-binding protein [Planctomycetaceae bacterium]|nr:nucleotide-binding protein [Planctomycetaceae bacterium]